MKPEIAATEDLLPSDDPDRASVSLADPTRHELTP